MTKLAEALDRFPWEVFLYKAVRAAILIACAWVIWSLARYSLKRWEAALTRRGRAATEPLSETGKRATTLIGLVRKAIFVVGLLVTVLGILSEFGVQIGPILASAGIAGLAIGFGAQNLVRDVISGFFMILEDQARVGDVVVVNGTGGLVEELNFRTLVLRDLSGTVHVFPNGTISTLANRTREWSAYVIDIDIAYDSDFDRAMDVLRAMDAEIRASDKFGPSVLEPIEIFGIDAFKDSAVTLSVRIKTLPNQQWTVGREYRKRILMAFREAGIEIPFPHRVIVDAEKAK